MAEKVEPEPIARAADTHVIGNEIEDNAHAPRLECGGKRAKILDGADLGVDQGVVDRVVAMRTARLRLEDG